jgi:hypothetical protein
MGAHSQLKGDGYAVRVSRFASLPMVRDGDAAGRELENR